MYFLHLYGFQNRSNTASSLFANASLIIKPLLSMKKLLTVGNLLFIFFIPLNIAFASQIFSTDFESGTLSEGKSQEGGFFWRVGRHASVTSEKSKTGSYSLKIAYPTKNDNGYSHAEQPFHIGDHYPEIWIKYDLFVPANYEHKTGKITSNNKGFVHLWAGSYDGANREGPLLGPNFWPNNGGSKIVMWGGARVNGKITMDKHWSTSDGRHNGAITSNDKGKWMTIVLHVKYASISNDDGIYEAWKIDSSGKMTKLLDIHNGPWYSTKPNSTEPARGFNEGYLLGWANSGFDETTTFYIDNFIMATHPLLNDLAKPNPPKLMQ